MEQKMTLGWRIKNSLFFILSFIPFLQWIPFFVMNGKIPRKKWIVLGFANIVILLVAVGIGLMASSYRDNNRPDKPAGEPRMRDYVGERYWENPNYTDTEEYKQYSADYDAYTSTPEYLAYEKEYERVYRNGSQFSVTSSGLHVINWIVFMVLGFFVERYRYLRALAGIRNREAVYGQLSGRADLDLAEQITVKQTNAEPISVKQTNAEPISVNQANQSKSSIPAQARMDISADARLDIPADAKTNSLLNVNTATEEELMQLPGMKTIDAKKIISYRAMHGGFTSEDEFFNCFDVKPHIMVKMQKLISLQGAVATENGHSTEGQNQGSDAKRRFDF